MNLRIENILYNLICILPDKENLKVVIRNTLEEVGTLNKFNNIITYQLTSSIEDYIEDLYRICFEDKNKALEILEVIIDLWKKNHKNIFDMNEDDAKQYIKNLFGQVNNEDIWFLSLLSGQLSSYYYLRDRSTWSFILDEEYEDLKNTKLKYEELKDKEELRKNRDKNNSKDQIYRNSIREFKGKVKESQIQIKDLKDNIEALTMKNQELQGKLALFGKSIVVVGVNWNKDLIENLILEYNLSSLECLSGIEIKNIASKVINKDIVVFQLRKHSMISMI